MKGGISYRPQVTRLGLEEDHLRDSSYLMHPAGDTLKNSCPYGGLRYCCTIL